LPSVAHSVRAIVPAFAAGQAADFVVQALVG